MSQLYTPEPPKSPQELSRVSSATARAIEVYGNDFHAAMWLGERPPMRPGKRWMTWREIAEDSDEGLQEVLGRLNELAQTVTPQELPASIRAARNGRRVRRKKSDFK